MNLSDFCQFSMADFNSMSKKQLEDIISIGNTYLAQGKQVEAEIIDILDKANNALASK